MRLRTAAFTAVAIALAATTTPAIAAKKPAKICNLVTDAKGDGEWDNASMVKSDALDVISADIATGKTEFVAVLRVAAADLKSALVTDSYANLGYTWRMSGVANGNIYQFEARKAAGNSQELRHSVAVAGAGVSGYTFTVVGNSLIWKFKRSATTALARPKLVWTDFNASTAVLSTSADSAEVSKRKYPDRALSCVVAK